VETVKRFLEKSAQKVAISLVTFGKSSQKMLLFLALFLKVQSKKIAVILGTFLRPTNISNRHFVTQKID